MVFDYCDKIAANGEGCKPDLNQQKQVAESELALLSILYKLIIDLFFHRTAVSNTDESRNNKRLIFLDTKSLCANVTRFAKIGSQDWQSSKVNALNHCVGSSNTSRLIQRILLKLATVCSDWDFQHILCLHSKFRLRTLGVPVSKSDSREPSRNSLTPRSRKLKLRIFFSSP